MPVRAAPELALTWKLMTPVAFPLLPLVMPAQGTVLDAVHAQPLVVCSVTVPPAPAAGTSAPGLLRTKVHEDEGCPACSTIPA